METQTYIIATIENMFHRKNERQIVIAYLFRKLLNQTPLEVGRYLKMSRLKVNMLNTTRLYMLSSEDYVSEHFQASFKACLSACSDYATLSVARRFKESLAVTKERFDSHYFLLN